MLELLTELTRRVESLQRKSVDIRNSVANGSNEKPANYLLPVSLVKAAEKIFQLIHTLRYSVEALNTYGRHAGPSRVELVTHLSLVEHFAVEANAKLSEARYALLLMVHTGRLHSPVINIHITLETSLMSLFIGLSRKKLVGDLCALEMYHQHLMSMVCATKTMLHYLILMLDSTTRQVDDHPNSPSGTFTFWTKRSK